MQRYIILASLIGLVSLGTLQAQISDKLMPHFGFMYEFTTVSQSSSPEEPRVLDNAYVLNVGAYYMLAQKNDVVSVGIEPSLQIGISPVAVASRFRLGYTVQTPIYAMARLGAGSTPYNQQRIGIAAGIGGAFNAFSYFIPTSQVSGLNDRGNFFAPGAVVEVTINSRGNPLILRAHVSLAQSALTFNRRDLEGNDIPPLTSSSYPNRAGYLGLGVLYNFSL